MTCFEMTLNWHFLRVVEILRGDFVGKVGFLVKNGIFDDFGSKSLKSDNFDFFRNSGFIEKNEGVILR